MTKHSAVWEERWRIQDISDVAVWDWASRGACVNSSSDPDLWFAAEASLQRAHLTRICTGCPVIQECLEHALLHNERGWWGGTSRAERNRALGRYAAG